MMVDLKWTGIVVRALNDLTFLSIHGSMST